MCARQVSGGRRARGRSRVKRARTEVETPRGKGALSACLLVCCLLARSLAGWLACLPCLPTTEFAGDTAGRLWLRSAAFRLSERAAQVVSSSLLSLCRLRSRCVFAPRCNPSFYLFRDAVARFRRTGARLWGVLEVREEARFQSTARFPPR